MKATHCQLASCHPDRTLRRRALTVLFLVLLTNLPGEAKAQLSEEQDALLAAIARGKPIAPWVELSAAQLQELEVKAESYLANYQKYHQPYGLTANLRFSGRERSIVEMFDGIGDAATWTGHYLAGLAFRYAATSDPKTLKDIHQVLDACDRLTRVTGKIGFIARFAGPADDPAFQRYYNVYGGGADPTRPGFGKWAFRGVAELSHWVWLGYPSRDVYVGVNLGLATAYRLAPEPQVRERIRNLIESILDCLLNDGWVILDNEGRRSQDQSTPSMVASLLRTGAAVNPAKYQLLYQEKAGLVLSTPTPSLCKYCSYYPNNLEFAAYYVLATLESDPARKTAYQAKIGEMWQQCSDHLNAYFACLYVSATGASSNRLARATIQGGLADFPAAPRWDELMDYSPKTDLELTRLEGKQWVKHAWPVRQRIPSDFIWQRSPCELKGGSDAALEYPGIDFLLPYWMARACNVLSQSYEKPSY